MFDLLAYTSIATALHSSTQTDTGVATPAAIAGLCLFGGRAVDRAHHIILLFLSISSMEVNLPPWK